MNTKIPTQVYAEMTPNPATMKFVSDRELVEDGKHLDISNQIDAKKHSPLAAELFNFPFVKRVFIAANYVTVTKDESLEWDMIIQQLRTYIREWLVDNQIAVTSIPDIVASEEKTTVVSANDKQPVTFSKSEHDEKIIDLLDTYVRPAVEQDGGAIDFIGFDNGIVYVELKGACSGCPSSTQTLKGGIEQLLKTETDVVTEVVAVM